MRSHRALAAAAIVLAATAAGCGAQAAPRSALSAAPSSPVARPSAVSVATAAVPATAASQTKRSAGRVTKSPGAGTPAARATTPPPVAPAPTPPAGAGTPTGTPGGWGNPVFTDQFNGTSLSSAWGVYDSPWASTPRTPQSVQVRNGALQLIAHNQSPYGYVGGGVSLNVNQTYGRWVVRFRADAGAGSSAIVLLWPAGTWPDDGEIDVAEIDAANRHGTGEFLHMGPQNNIIGHPVSGAVDFTQWHTMALDWLPDHITFWLDGTAQWTVWRSSSGVNYIPSTPFHLALQLDAGCDTGCKPNAQTPQQVIMQVDWVQVFKAP